jgi:chromatin structure-remodeling complex subunit RSC1/2
MAVVNYDRQVEPEVMSSPFHKGAKGPGFFGEPKGRATEEEEEEPKPRLLVTPTPRPVVGLPPSMPIAASPVPPSPAQRVPAIPWSSNSKSIAALLGGSQILDQVASKETLPGETG